MKIIQLKAENIKNLKVVQINPEDNAVILSGKNEAGKSAILDTIEMTLAGKKLENPIRKGQKKATSEIVLDDYIVKRIITEKTDRLEITSPEGMTYKSPRTLLDKILGKLSFDPLSFAAMASTADGQRKQRKFIMEIAGLDFADIDKQKQETYEERKALNKEISIRESSLLQNKDEIDRLSVQDEEEETPVEIKINLVETLESKHKEWARAVSAVQDKENVIAALKLNLTTIDSEIKRLQDKRALIIAEGKQAVQELEKLKAKIPNQVTEEEIDIARKEIATTVYRNEHIKKFKDHKKSVLELARLRGKSEGLTDKLQEYENKKLSLIGKAVFPIDGLGITDDVVTFKDIPFSQLSTGQQINVSTQIAMALNPQLRIILVREGSLLDSNNLQAVINAAKERDYQIWIEKVDDTGQVGIYIEDGAIAKTHEEF